MPQRGYEELDTRRMKTAGIVSAHMASSWAQVGARRRTYDWSLVDEIVSTKARVG